MAKTSCQLEKGATLLVKNHDVLVVQGLHQTLRATISHSYNYKNGIFFFFRILFLLNFAQNTEQLQLSHPNIYNKGNIFIQK